MISAKRRGDIILVFISVGFSIEPPRGQINEFFADFDQLFQCYSDTFFKIRLSVISFETF